MRTTYLILLLLIIFSSCKTSVSETTLAVKTAQNGEMLFLRNVPENKKGEPCYMYKRCRELTKQFGIDSLTNGFDSLRIRFWFFAGMNSKKQVLDISCRNNKWTGYFIDQTDEEAKDIKNRAERKNVTPHSSWEEYIKSIVTSRVLSLPDEEAIEGWGVGGGDLGLICIEIGTSNFYRFYSYVDYEEHVKLPQFAQLLKIVQRTEKEFDFKRLSKTE